MQAGFGVVVTALLAILGVEVVVIVLGRSASAFDVAGGLFVTLAGMAAALLAQALGRGATRRLGGSPRVGTVVGLILHTAVAAYALFIATDVDAPFGWLLGILFGAIIGSALPTLVFGPRTGWAAAITAARILAFVGLTLLLASRSLG